MTDLVPEANVTIICPYPTSIRATQDFTHDRPPVSPGPFLYMNKGWRTQNKPTHGHPIVTSRKRKQE